ncbi:hypothetical protein D3C87_1480520 [compost metagenome]
MHDADDLDRRTGAEGEYVRRIAQRADIHGAGIQRFAEGSGSRKLGELDVVRHVLQLAGDFQQHFDRGFLIGHQQRLQIGGVAGCSEAKGAKEAQQQRFW